MDFKCLQCGKEFTGRPSHPRTFCSTMCKALFQKGKGEPKIVIDEQRMVGMYVDAKISTVEIAEAFGTNKKFVRARLVKAGVNLRSRGEAKSLFLMKHPDENPNFLPGAEEKQRRAQITTNSKTNAVQKRADSLSKVIREMPKAKRAAWLDELKKSARAFTIFSGGSHLL